ncbi:aldehyde dehydrogenase family protein [Escherichia coli]|uniref:aldehyde dehydrogenase family protein n=1 Tax=Escherichia coli TaxID=562 RepID=UPI001AECB2FA|nr:aldehyde dehydrogenase family protein [Escherichia coli]MBP2821090.1 aldehyde dehydrogenase family protein [Escherichia coli]
MNQQDIEQVVKAVLLKMQSSDTPSAAVHEMGVFASLDDAVAAAKVAQQGLKSVAMRQLAIAAIREAGEKHARDLAELAVSETGMGRVEDKFAKNVAQARGTPGVECLSPQVLTGDNGLTLIENAPWGVVASVTPSTNPAATVINNAISLIAAGNSVIFAPHPAAKKVSQRAITLLNQAIVAAGGPENLLVTVANPDIETAQRLFKFPGIGLLVLPVVRVANVADAIALAVKLEGGCHHTAAMHSRNIENMNQMANAIDTSIFVKNGPCIAGLGLGGEGWTTMTITTPTGEGVTSARTFVRLRRCVLVDAFRIV